MAVCSRRGQWREPHLLPQRESRSIEEWMPSFRPEELRLLRRAKASRTSPIMNGSKPGRGSRSETGMPIPSGGSETKAATQCRRTSRGPRVPRQCCPIGGEKGEGVAMACRGEKEAMTTRAWNWNWTWKLVRGGCSTSRSLSPRGDACKSSLPSLSMSCSLQCDMRRSLVGHRGGCRPAPDEAYRQGHFTASARTLYGALVGVCCLCQGVAELHQVTRAVAQSMRPTMSQ